MKHIILSISIVLFFNNFSFSQEIFKSIYSTKSVWSASKGEWVKTNESNGIIKFIFRKDKIIVDDNAQSEYIILHKTESKDGTDSLQLLDETNKRCVFTVIKLKGGELLFSIKYPDSLYTYLITE